MLTGGQRWPVTLSGPFGGRKQSHGRGPGDSALVDRYRLITSAQAGQGARPGQAESATWPVGQPYWVPRQRIFPGGEKKKKTVAGSGERRGKKMADVSVARVCVAHVWRGRAADQDGRKQGG